MKITEVESFYLRLPDIQERTDSSQDAFLVRVSTDAGIVGWGEVDGCPWVSKAIFETPYSHTMVRGLRQSILGEGRLEIARLRPRPDPYRGRLRNRARGARPRHRTRPGHAREVSGAGITPCP